MLALALALLLLPGLLVVRAPWTAVPALSIAFWVLSSAWQGTHGSRAGFLSAAVLGSALIATLRALPKSEVMPPPGVELPPEPTPQPRPGLLPPPVASRASALVVIAAALLLLPLPKWHNAPGPDLAFQTTAARLLLARDGVPRSAEPLLPLPAFVVHPPALASLAADTSALTGLDPARSVALVVAGSAALVVVGGFSLLAVWLEPSLAALATVVALALVPWPGWLSACGTGPSMVALALALPAAALLVGHASRSSGAASAMLFSAGLLAQPLVALVVLAASSASVSWSGRSLRLRRIAAVTALAAALALPRLVPMIAGISARELGLLLLSASSREVLQLLAAVVVLVAVPASLAVLHRRWPALRGAPAPALPPEAGPVTRSLGVPVTPRHGASVATALVFLAASILLAMRFAAWMDRGQLSPESVAALRRAAQTSDSLEVLCAGPELRDWVPAIAGRAAGEPGPWLPAVYADEWQRRQRQPCRPLGEAAGGLHVPVHLPSAQ